MTAVFTWNLLSRAQIGDTYLLAMVQSLKKEVIGVSSDIFFIVSEALLQRAV